MIGYNLYAYCSNNPVMRKDTGGEFWDTVFDLVSLTFSVIDVINNPDDPWAWVGLAGDLVDVIVPCVGGVGEVTRAVSKGKKAVDAVDDVHDAAKIVDNVGDATKAVKRFTPDQDVVLQMAKEAHKSGGISKQEAETLWGWAQEYGLNGKRYHGPKFDSYQEGKIFHMKINGLHINIFD